MWIIKIAITLFLCHSFLGVGFAQQEGDCRDQGSRVGNGEGHDEILPDCVSLFKSKAATGAYKKNVLGNTEVYAYKNIIFFEDQSGISIITGKSSGLKDVESFVIDELNKEIVVLEKSGAVLTFSTLHKGNIGPKRILMAKQLPGATEVGIDHENNQLVVYNKQMQKAFVFSRLANVRGKKLHKKLDLIKTVDGVGSMKNSKTTGKLSLHRPSGELIQN